MTPADLVEVDVALGGGTVPAGRLRRHAGRRGETATFEYARSWLEAPERFAIDPGLPLGLGTFAPTRGRAVPISRRFDRTDGRRVPFVSAMTLTDSTDGEPGSYPDIVDALSAHGARAGDDAAALYRRVAFNVLASNVDDHLRNHGALHVPGRGWRLAPAYDLNPVPADLKAHVLSTTIDGEEATCSVELVRESAPLYGLDDRTATRIVVEVARATRRWRETAARLGERPAAIERMASAFEHEALDAALALDR